VLHIQRLAIIASAGLLAAVTPSVVAKTTALGVPAAAAPAQHRPFPGARQNSRVHHDTCSGSGQYSFIGGNGSPSQPNTAAGSASGILSGGRNYACGEWSGVAVGSYNEADGAQAFIGGGFSNTAGGTQSFVGGGSSNTAGANGSFVGGGTTNNAGQEFDGILAGLGNSTAGVGFGGDGIVAGSFNNNQGFRSLIGAGDSNTSTSICTSICGPSAMRGGFGTAIVAGQSNKIDGSAVNTANYGLIGAGQSNTLKGQWAAILAGYSNTESADYAFVGAGSTNSITGAYGSIVGGYKNTVSASNAFVGGGSNNLVGGQNAVVPGGLGNVANGFGSFAAGSGAKALHNGAFVWSDQNVAPVVKSTASKQFIARASGGVTFYSSTNMSTGVKLAAGSGSWSSVSDRAVKTAIVPLDDAVILAKVASLPVSEWSYVAQGAGVRHVGPMAQDFYAAFGVGEDDKHITTIDEGGVALAAIKGLSVRSARENVALLARLAKADAEIASLRAELARLTSTVAKLRPAR
jgi:hypothetical protein